MIVLFAQQSGGGGIGTIFSFLVIGVLFYFLLIRPQQKRARDQRNLVNSLGVGDLVVTIGGFHGTITDIDDSTVRLELNPTNTVTLSKQAIARRLVDADSGDDAEEVTGR